MTDAYIKQMHEAAAEQAFYAAQDSRRPSMMLRPRLSIDGDKWCALHGEDLQNGVAGFGDSPAEAYIDFDAQWTHKLDPKPRPRIVVGTIEEIEQRLRIVLGTQLSGHMLDKMVDEILGREHISFQATE